MMQGSSSLAGTWVLLLVGMLASCSRSYSSDAALIPPPTPPLTRTIIGYGVIELTYTQVLAEPNSQGLSLGYLRKGEIVQIRERRISAMEPWVFVIGEAYRGWLQESAVQIFDNEAQAITAAKRLIQ